MTAPGNTFAAVVLATATGSGCASSREVVSPTPTPEVAVTPPSVARPRSSAGAQSTYADGVYTATGQYGSLPSSITVTVTLAAGPSAVTRPATVGTPVRERLDWKQATLAVPRKIARRCYHTLRGLGDVAWLPVAGTSQLEAA
jgi:hypothetical protein